MRYKHGRLVRKNKMKWKRRKMDEDEKEKALMSRDH